MSLTNFFNNIIVKLSQNHLIGKKILLPVNWNFTNGKINQFYWFTAVKIAHLNTNTAHGQFSTGIMIVLKSIIPPMGQFVLVSWQYWNPWYRPWAIYYWYHDSTEIHDTAHGPFSTGIMTVLKSMIPPSSENHDTPQFRNTWYNLPSLKILKKELKVGLALL